MKGMMDLAAFLKDECMVFALLIMLVSMPLL